MSTLFARPFREFLRVIFLSHHKGYEAKIPPVSGDRYVNDDGFNIAATENNVAINNA